MAGASSFAKGLTNLPGEPVETNSRSSICSQSSSACSSVSSGTASAENIKTLHEGSHGGDGQINPMLESQLLPPAQERSLLMSLRDDIQLQENLLTESPDFEDAVSSMEPLLPDSIFPPLDPTEPRESGQAQEVLETPPQPCDDTGGQSQEPQAMPIPRPSQGKPSEAPNKPELNMKAKREKSPASEGEPSRKGMKTNKSSDPTTAPNASGEGTALGAHKKPCSSLIGGKKGGRVATSFDDIGVKSQEPQAKTDVPIPRPSQGKPTDAPKKPKLNTKAKRGKSPASEGEPSRKVRKTKKSSDPTTAPNVSGEGTALEAHKKPCSSLASGKNGGKGTKKAAKGPANRDISLTIQSAESGKDLALSKASKATKKKTTTSVTAGVGPKQVATQEPPKPIPKSHLAMQMTESLNVFYPQRKGKPQLVPVKKQRPLAPSAPEYPFPLPETWARPLPTLPRIPKISASHSSRQPPSKSVASSVPIVAYRACNLIPPLQTKGLPIPAIRGPWMDTGGQHLHENQCSPSSYPHVWAKSLDSGHKHPDSLGRCVTALGAHKKPYSSLISGKKGSGSATSFDDIGGPSQEPQAKKDVPIPRPSQGKPTEAPDKPNLNTKAKRGKSPASEGEPSRKVRKTKKNSDPTTAPNASGEGTALGAHKL